MFQAENNAPDIDSENMLVEMDANSLAELVLTFFTGLCMEQNVSSSRAEAVRKVDKLMSIIRTL